MKITLTVRGTEYSIKHTKDDRWEMWSYRKCLGRHPHTIRMFDSLEHIAKSIKSLSFLADPLDPRCQQLLGI